jgi:hypothetical protein
MVVSFRGRGAEGQRGKNLVFASPLLPCSPAPLPTSTQQFWVGELLSSSGYFSKKGRGKLTPPPTIQLGLLNFGSPLKDNVASC